MRVEKLSQQLIDRAQAAGLTTNITSDLFLDGQLPQWVVIKNSSASSSVQELIYESIQEISEFSEYQQNMLCFAAFYKPDLFLTTRDFFKNLNEIEISDDEKRIVAAILAPRIEIIAHCSAWIDLADQLRKQYGMVLVIDILNMCPNQPDPLKIDQSEIIIINQIKIAELLIYLKPYFDKKSKKHLSDIFVQHQLMQSMIEYLTTCCAEYKALQPAGKSVEALTADFAGVKRALKKSEFEFLLSQLKEINKIGSQEYEKKSLYYLSTQVTLMRERFKINANDQDAKYHLLAIIREVIRQQFGIKPYGTQMMAVLALLNYPAALKGRVAEMKTGQGKSTVITMLAAFLACQGRSVDIITTNHSLAKRDCEKYTAFYAVLGISCSHICNQHPMPNDFNGQILYGTSADFRFALMNDALQYTTHQKLRSPDVGITDEADDFLIRGSSDARIATSSSINVSWVYQPITDLFLKIKSEAMSQLPIETLREMLSKHSNPIYAAQAKLFSTHQLSDWKNSVIMAYVFQEGDQYIVKNGKVIIAEKDTGHLAYGSLWPGGLQQFIELKHGIAPSKENNTIAAMSNRIYFSRYKSLFGLTGTAGEKFEVQEIETHEVEVIDIPMQQAPVDTNIKTVMVSKTVTEQFEKIIVAIDECQRNGRPVLILFETINDTRIFAKKLSQKKLSFLVLNEEQTESEHDIINRAGHKKAITIATNMAGRGTDIILTSEALAAGGLKVIFGFLPGNARVQKQGEGRAGRQGQPGSAEMILSLMDPMIQQLIDDNQNSFLPYFTRYGDTFINHREFITLLFDCRAAAVKKTAEQRALLSEQDLILNAMLNDFFICLSDVVDALNNVDINELKNKIGELRFSSTADEFLVMHDHPIIKCVTQLLDQPISESIIVYLKKAFQDLLRDRWARFYTHISHHSFNELTVEDYAREIYLQFKGFCDEGYAALRADPLEGFYAWAAKIVNGNEMQHAPSSYRFGSSALFQQVYADDPTMATSSDKLSIRKNITMPLNVKS